MVGIIKGKGANPPFLLKAMQSGLFKLNWKDIVSAVMISVVVGILMYIGKLTDVAQISGHAILNIIVLTGSGSLLTSLLTTSKGNFAGVAPVK